jgi:uncharacterized protein YjdB
MLIASVLPASATNKGVLWTSKDELIASVNILGEVTGLSPGETTIIATSADGGFKDSCTVSVIEAFGAGCQNNL